MMIYYRTPPRHHFATMGRKYHLVKDGTNRPLCWYTLELDYPETFIRLPENQVCGWCKRAFKDKMKIRNHGERFGWKRKTRLHSDGEQWRYVCPICGEIVASSWVSRHAAASCNPSIHFGKQAEPEPPLSEKARLKIELNEAKKEIELLRKQLSEATP